MVYGHKQKFTRLQQEVLEVFFLYAGQSFNANSLGRKLNKSATSVLKAIKLLKKNSVLIVDKDKETNQLSIYLNLENERVIEMKRVWNLDRIYSSGLYTFLREKFPGATIILFGSYSGGTDLYTANSDIDIAIVGYKDRNVKEMDEFGKAFQRIIVLHFYDSFKEINKNLKENLANGILLEGSFKL